MMMCDNMKYYEGCKLTVGVPVTGKFDEATIRKALDEVLPGIEITFRHDSSITVLEAAGAFVPHDHLVAGAQEQDPKTKKTVSVGGRLILTAGPRSQRLWVRPPPGAVPLKMTFC
jgi:hypothetical protein